MFPKGGQTRKHCFLSMFPKGGQTRKHCFLGCLPSALLYCVSFQFDFNAVILSWWTKQGPQYWLHLDCLDTAYCIGGRISLTDTGEPCHGLDFGIWWFLCLPCYFMLAIPYKIWRNVVCQIWDYCVKISGDINAVSNISDLPQLS